MADHGDTRAVRSPGSSMAGLVHHPGGYDLAESTRPAACSVQLGDLAAQLPLGYGTSRARLGSPIGTVRLRFDDCHRLPVDAIADGSSPATGLVPITSRQDRSGVAFAASGRGPADRPGRPAQP